MIKSSRNLDTGVESRKRREGLPMATDSDVSLVTLAASVLLSNQGRLLDPAEIERAVRAANEIRIAAQKIVEAVKS